MAFLLFRKGYVLPKHEKALIDKAQKRAKHLQVFHDELLKIEVGDILVFDNNKCMKKVTIK